MKNKKVAKRNNKKILKFGIFSGIALLGGVTAAVAAACGSSNISNQIFTFNNYTDVLQNNNSPLNPTFTYQPISTYAQSAMISLLTYETSGGFKFDQNGNATETTKTTLKLEAATKVEGFDASGNPTGSYKRNPEGLEECSKKKVVDETDQDLIDFQSKTVKYVFTIDTNIKWVDKDGVVKDSLSGKDFERGLETYKLSSDLGYNRNGYFISLTGLKFDETVGYKNSSGDYVSVDSPNYDINNYNNPDNTFTLYLSSPYPYIFSILTKDYFNPLPHNNKYVQNIRVTDSNTPLAIDTDSKGKRFLNQQNTNWNEIYGSGQVGTFLNNSWFAGAYYFNKFSRNQIVGILNQSYMDSVGPSLDPENGKKIKTFLMNYGSGNPEVDYENFAAGQISYLSAVPNAKRAEAIGRFLGNKSLYVSSVVKISQSNYIAYTPKPYVFDSNGVVTVNNPPNATTISNDAAQMIYNWNSEPSVTIRTGLSGLINHYQLSKLNISSGDFQYSNVPYGSLDISGLSDPKLNQYGDYYKAIDNDALYGGLPRKASDYHQGTSDINNVFTGAYSSFRVPYYSYVYDNAKPDVKPKVEEKQLTINKNTFIQSLKDFGATSTNPFVLQYKYGQGSLSDNYDNYLKALKRAIEALGTDSSGDKFLVFNLVNRQAPNPSVNDWYSNQRSSLGFSLWAPDYNGVGTWLEANGTLDDNGLSSTNNHNIFNSLLRVLIMSAIDQNVSSIQLTDPAAPTANTALAPTSSVFDNDPRIQAAFGSQEPGVENNGGSVYAKLGVEFLQYLVDNGVLNKDAVNQLISDPSILQKQGTIQGPPKTESDLYPLLLDNNSKTSQLKDKDGKDISIFNQPKDSSKPNGSAEEFSKYLGIWAGLSPQNALWATLTMDNDYELLPLSEGSLREKIYSLVNTHFFVRTSSIGSPTIRDYEQL